MKLNRKGFTLIELLVVIALIIIITGIAIPTVTSTINRSREKEKNSKISLIEEAGEKYYKEHMNSLNRTKGTITINTLVTNGYLTKDEIIDPFKNNTSISGKVCYCTVNNQKIFTYLESGTCSC